VPRPGRVRAGGGWLRALCVVCIVGGVFIDVIGFRMEKKIGEILFEI
jgi:hypothetical protein